MNPNEPAYPGITLRAYIATRCLQGMLSSGNWPNPDEQTAYGVNTVSTHFADMAVSYADALIVRLNQRRDA